MASMIEITWNELKQKLNIGSVISGTILRHEPYGVFVDIGYPYEGLIQITDFKDEGKMTPKDYPPVGSIARTVVLGFKDRWCQVWLGVKPSQFGDVDTNSEA